MVYLPDVHVAQAEHGTRTMQETLRAMVQAKPYLAWFGRFAIEANTTATAYISMQHAKSTRSRLSPFQMLAGVKPSIERDFKATFGELVLLENSRDVNTKCLVSRPRMEVAVWL